MAKVRKTYTLDDSEVDLIERMRKAKGLPSDTAVISYALYVASCLDPAFREVERKRLADEYAEKMAMLDRMDTVVGRPHDASPEELVRRCPDGTPEQVFDWSLNKAPALAKSGVSVAEFVERRADESEAQQVDDSLRSRTRPILIASLEVVNGNPRDREKYTQSLRKNLEALRLAQVDYMPTLESLIERKYADDGPKMLDLIKQLDSELNVKCSQEIAHDAHN